MKISEQLRKSILQAAIQGKLTEQHESDGSAYDLLQEIKVEKEQLIKDKVIKKSKPLASITDKEIPFDIPENWEWVRLGVVTNYGETKSVKPSVINDGEWILELEDIKKDSFELLIKDKTKKTKSNKNKFNSGDLLYGKLRPYLKKIIVADEDGYCSTEIIPFKGYSNIKTHYLMYLMASPYVDETVNNITHGMDMPRLGTQKARNLLIPLPPLAEQQRIVEKIEELLPELDKLKEQEEIASKADTELPEKLRKSFLQAAMQGKLTEQLESDGTAYDLLEQIKTEKEQLIKDKKIKKEKTLLPITDEEIPFDIPENWSWVRLGNVLNIFTGNSISVSVKTQKYMKDIEGYPYIATKDVSFEKTINYDNGVIIPFDENRFNVVKVRTPLLCIEGGSAGRKIGFTNQQVCFGNKLCAFEAYSQLIDSKYVFYFLQSPEFINQFSESINGIIGGVGTTKLKSFIISIPPVLEQKRIVEKLDILFDKVDLLQ